MMDGGRWRLYQSGLFSILFHLFLILGVHSLSPRYFSAGEEGSGMVVEIGFSSDRDMSGGDGGSNSAFRGERSVARESGESGSSGENNESAEVNGGPGGVDGFTTAGSGDRPPGIHISGGVDRYFPESARQRDIQRGEVLVTIYVDQNGTLVHHEFQGPPAGNGFDGAARRLLQEATFTPGRRGGVAVPMKRRIKLVFQLK